MPLTNVTYNEAAIKLNGGKKWAIRKVNADGSNISGELWTDWSYREKFEPAFQQPSEDRIGESGDVISTDEGTVKTEFKITVAQTDAKLLNFLKDDVVNSYFSVYLDAGEDTGTTTQYWYAPIVKIVRGWENLSYKGRAPVVTLKPQYNPSAFTLSASTVSGGSISAWGAVGVQTCALGAYFSVTGV